MTSAFKGNEMPERPAIGATEVRKMVYVMECSEPY
jgi:hypothetical protein